MKKKKDVHIHKHGYGVLFTDKTLIKQLIESFVDPEFAAELDFSQFKPELEKSYISKDMRDYAEDLLIQVGLKGKKAYIYLLIEFQSTNDRFMALRMLNYLTLFYLDYIKENPKAKKLPPVLPILLYNGEEAWNAPAKFRELVEEHAFVHNFVPDFGYFMVIVREFTEEKLLKIGNAVSGIFLLETTPKERYELLIERLKDILKGETARTIALIAIWLKHLANNKRMPVEVFREVENIKNEKEAKSMLVNTLEELKKDWYEQGIEQGYEQGDERGFLRGVEQGVEQERIDAARKMLADKLPVELISKYTGLSETEVRRQRSEVR